MQFKFIWGTAQTHQNLAAALGPFSYFLGPNHALANPEKLPDCHHTQGHRQSLDYQAVLVTEDASSSRTTNP